MPLFGGQNPSWGNNPSGPVYGGAPAPNSSPAPAPGGSGISDLVTAIQGGVRNLGLVAQNLSGAFPHSRGQLTLAAATVTNVTVPTVTGVSIIQLTPTNGTATLTQSQSGLFLLSQTAGVGFTLSTRAGPAIGQETFQYVVWG